MIEKILAESLKVKETFVKENISELIRLADQIAQAFTRDRKLMLCGNGGERSRCPAYCCGIHQSVYA